MSEQQPFNEPEQAQLPNDDLILINDLELDPQTLMAEIRSRIKKRREEMGYDDRKFPSFGNALTYPEPPEDIDYPYHLYDHLQQANEQYAEVETSSILAPSPATRIPIVGSFWKLIREQMHNLVLFYVNRNLAHQVNMDRHIVNVLNQLTAQNAEQQRELIKLQEKIDRLEERYK